MFPEDTGERVSERHQVLPHRTVGTTATVVKGGECTGQVNGDVHLFSVFGGSDNTTMRVLFVEINPQVEREPLRVFFFFSFEFLFLKPATNFVDHVWAEDLCVGERNGVVPADR